MTPLLAETVEPLLTSGKAAALLGVCRQTVIDWASAGKLEIAHITQGGHYRFRGSDVQALLNRCAKDQIGPESKSIDDLARLEPGNQAFDNTTQSGDNSGLVVAPVLGVRP